MNAELSSQQISEIADQIFSRLNDAGMLLTENEAKEYKKLKAVAEVKLLTGVQVSRLLNVSPASVTRIRQSGQLKGVWVGGRWMYPQKEVQKYKCKIL